MASASLDLGFDDKPQGYQVTHLYVVDIDGKNCAGQTRRDFDRDIENPRYPPTAAACISYDERGVKKLGVVTLDGKVRTRCQGLAAPT